MVPQIEPGHAQFHSFHSVANTADHEWAVICDPSGNGGAD